MDDRAYPALVKYEGQDWKRDLPFGKGDQILRLESLDDDVREEFLDSFFEEVRYPISVLRNERSYVDPNFDGRDKGLYVKRIHDILKARQGKK
jgi:hypothetical protein